MTRPHLYGILVIVVTLVAFALSFTAGEPAKLPGAALGPLALLHVPRAAAFVVAFALLFTVIARAWTGELPIKFGSAALSTASGDDARDQGRDGGGARRHREPP
jgi:hypothetical protein